MSDFIVQSLMSQKHQFLKKQASQKKSEEYWTQGSEEFQKKVIFNF
jgi:hypothetical protein